MIDERQNRPSNVARLWRHPGGHARFARAKRLTPIPGTIRPQTAVVADCAKNVWSCSYLLYEVYYGLRRRCFRVATTPGCSFWCVDEGRKWVESANAT